MSVLLLIERTRCGVGPKIPLRDSYSRAKIEGLAPGGSVGIMDSFGPIMVFTENGEHKLPRILEKGTTVFASVVGDTNCATVELVQ